jgi:membrane AbrB-like protein
MNEANTTPLRTIVLGGAGAAVAEVAGVPAAPLIGASLAVSLAAWFGLRVRMHPWLRNLGFAGIGVSLGAGVRPTLFHDIVPWTLSLGFLAISLAVTLFTAAAILRRWFFHDQTTAILASSPGTMSYTLAVAEEGRGDVTVVLILQSLRLLLLASALPLAVFFLADVPARVSPAFTMAPIELAILVGLALALGTLLARTGLPAAILVSGMLVSGLSHFLGLSTGPTPGWAQFISFAITGCAIGARFSGVSRLRIRPLLIAACVTTAVATLVSGLFAVIVAWLTQLPAGQVWVAFAPGGVEAMAAIGIALGYDPAYVAIHHLTRILFLIIVLPVVLGRAESTPRNS